MKNIFLFISLAVILLSGCRTMANPGFWQTLSQTINEANQNQQRAYQQKFDNRMRAYEVLGNINRGHQSYRITDTSGNLIGYAQPQ